jgi:hypothetical protein
VLQRTWIYWLDFFGNCMLLGVYSSLVHTDRYRTNAYKGTEEWAVCIKYTQHKCAHSYVSVLFFAFRSFPFLFYFIELLTSIQYMISQPRRSSTSQPQDPRPAKFPFRSLLLLSYIHAPAPPAAPAATAPTLLLRRFSKSTARPVTMISSRDIIICPGISHFEPTNL